MIALFTVGMCIAMNGYYYKVIEVGYGVYNLQQTIVVFEEERPFTENYKISYIDTHAKTIDKNLRWRTCR